MGMLYFYFEFVNVHSEELSYRENWMCGSSKKNRVNYDKWTPLTDMEYSCPGKG